MGHKGYVHLPIYSIGDTPYLEPEPRWYQSRSLEHLMYNMCIIITACYCVVQLTTGKVCGIMCSYGLYSNIGSPGIGMGIIGAIHGMGAITGEQKG